MDTELTDQAPPINVMASRAKLFVDFSVLMRGAPISRLRAGRSRALAFRALQALREIAERNSDVSGEIKTCDRTLKLCRCHEPSRRTRIELHDMLQEIERVQGWFKLYAHDLNCYLGSAPTQSAIAAYQRALGPPAGRNKKSNICNAAPRTHQFDSSKNRQNK